MQSKANRDVLLHTKIMSMLYKLLYELSDYPSWHRIIKIFKWFFKDFKITRLIVMSRYTMIQEYFWTNSLQCWHDIHELPCQDFQRFTWFLLNEFTLFFNKKHFTYKIVWYPKTPRFEWKIQNVFLSKSWVVPTIFLSKV